MSVESLILALEGMEVVDLGQYLEEKMPVHPSHPKFYKMTWHSPSLGDICTDYQLLLNEHSGTHVDSFAHYVDKPNTKWIDEISIDSFFAPCVTIDATFLGKEEVLTKEHIIEWEKSHFNIEKGSAVFVDTGWMSKWHLQPNDKEYIYNYPGLGASAAKYLVEKQVKIVGIDTLSIDACNSNGDPAHNTLLPNEVLIVENLVNLGKLHDKKGFFMMLPLKIRKGSASPVRPIVFVDK